MKYPTDRCLQQCSDTLANVSLVDAIGRPQSQQRDACFFQDLLYFLIPSMAVTFKVGFVVDLHSNFRDICVIRDQEIDISERLIMIRCLISAEYESSQIDLRKDKESSW